MKTVIYGATRNIYPNLVPCMNSVLLNGNIDEVILLIEDDIFPLARTKLTEKVKVINVAEQKWFDKNGVNARKRWTYMTLIKVCASKLIKCDKALFLDCDTIVEKDLSSLWEIDLSDYYYGAVLQPDDGRCGRFKKGDYFNAGVLLCNLKNLRNGTDDLLIKALQDKDYEFPEQDAINELCEGRILSLPGRYNVSPFTVKDTEVSILHFAADRNWINNEYARKYREVEI